MQGRLSPQIDGKIQAFPVDHWQDEFFYAAEIGFTSIEFIFEYENVDKNPLLTENGRNLIKELKKECNVRVDHICADYFMQKPFFGISQQDLYERIKLLKELIIICSLTHFNDALCLSV